MALLKLSEYQSNIRMNTESKYGESKDLEKMAKLTSEIVNLFDRISIESGEKIPLPHEGKTMGSKQNFRLCRQMGN